MTGILLLPSYLFRIFLLFVFVVTAAQLLQADGQPAIWICRCLFKSLIWQGRFRGSGGCSWAHIRLVKICIVCFLNPLVPIHEIGMLYHGGSFHLYVAAIVLILDLTDDAFGHEHVGTELSLVCPLIVQDLAQNHLLLKGDSSV